MQVAFFLPQNFVSSSERNQMSESFQRHALTIADMFIDDFL
jgi:hypothetical protein